MPTINHHNRDYSGGIPLAVGDRYYAQDIFRDAESYIDDSGRKVANGFVGFPVLLKDSAMTKGTNWDDLDIPVAKGIVEYEVDVPNSYAALPPTVTQEDIYVRIETAAETDFDISGATLDGVTVNYVKVTYSETNGSSRTRAKKAGTYVYEKAISYTITVTPAAPTNKDLVLGTVVGDGATFLTIVSYPRTRHYSDEYDYVVSSQDEFNVIIDRTAANQYRIKDNIKSIYVKFLTGGYQMTGATSPLQGGDAYGYIETNDCTRIVFEPGAFIDMHQNIGYLEVDTDYCYLDGVSIQGDKGAASAIARSFLLNANYVTFNNCSSEARLSNAAITIFEGSGTAKHNETSKVIGCRVENIDSSGNVYCFRYFHNLTECVIYDIESTATNVFCLSVIEKGSNCEIKQIDASTGMEVISDSYKCSNIDIEDIDVSGGNAIGIHNSDDCSNINMVDFDATACVGAESSDRLSNIYINDFNATAGTCYGIGTNCNFVSNCKIDQLDATGNCYAYFSSNQLSNCYCEDIDSSTGDSIGFNNCDYLSNCKAFDIDDAAGNSYGYYQCNHVGQSEGNDCADYGFYDCDYLSACLANTNGIDGFKTCNFGAACKSVANGADGYNDCDGFQSCRAENNTGDGFQDCNACGGNRSIGSGGAAYNNCFANWGGTVAVADTAAGGWNG